MKVRHATKKDPPKKRYRVSGQRIIHFNEHIVFAEDQKKAREAYEHMLEKKHVLKTGQTEDIIVEEMS